MSKSRNRKARSQSENPQESYRGKRRTLMLAIILITLLMTGGALAQWTGVFSASQKSQSKTAELSPASFAASAPAKEIVYLGGKPIVTEEPPGACTVSLLTTSQSFAASAGSGSVSVTAGTGCNWTATSNASWLTITSGSPGTGNGTVQYTVTANTDSNRRDGTLSIAGQIFTVYQGITFADVPQNHDYYTLIGKLVARGVTAGCGNGNYCPTDSVTREQMAVFIIKSRGEFTPPTPPTQRFNDVLPSSPFYPFIDRMAVLNITAGCSTTPPLYCPTATITHQEMAVFIIKALGMTTPPPPQMQRFSDVPPSSPFYAFIDQMAERGIWPGCNGVAGSNYCPTSAVTREQMAALLVRAFNL